MEKEISNGNYTKKFNSQLGWLGLLGLLGLIGFWSYPRYGMIFPFCFFAFFGFFAFFFEGKMQNILKDEMFIENETKARLKAYKVGFVISWIMVFVCTQSYLYMNNIDFLLIFLVISMSMNTALVIVLNKFYLYRFEKWNCDFEEKDSWVNSDVN